MQVSTKLFNQQSVNQFGKLTEEIQKLQGKVSTGKNILKSSCLLYTSPSPRDPKTSRMPSSA